MGIIKKIHHLEFQTKSFRLVYDYFINSLSYQVFSNSSNKLVFTSGSTKFIAGPLLDHNLSTLDTVFDIALEVENVGNVVERAINYNVEVLSYPKTIRDVTGSVITAKIRSCVGNVVHTLICSKDYNGVFLPEYKLLNSVHDSCQVKCFDHITFAVPNGTSDSIIEWYHDLFGMKRIKINSDDSPTDGFVVRHNDGGMKLKAFDYWRCAEVGMNNEDESCKFIIAEELNDKVPNQIGTFLREHGGPGIQHVGLLVNDIVSTARTFHSNGAKFMSIPRQYYELIEKRLPIRDLDVSLVDLEKYGILIDSESVDTAIKNGDNDARLKYLLQVFTRPIFDRDTFFLELIERQGATGFGAGNIKALWDAVDASLESSSTDHVVEQSQ